MYIYIYRERERYLYVYMCMYIYIYIYTYIYVHTCLIRYDTRACRAPPARKVLDLDRGPLVAACLQNILQYAFIYIYIYIYAYMYIVYVSCSHSCPNPYRKQLPKCLPKLFPWGVVVRFRAVVAGKSSPKALRTTTSEVVLLPEQKKLGKHTSSSYCQ